MRPIRLIGEAASEDVMAQVISGGKFIATIAALCIGLFGFAFVAAPHSCEWGIGAYAWAGAATVVALMALPFIAGRASSLTMGVCLSLGLGIAGCVVWLAGLFAANVRIICSLI